MAAQSKSKMAQTYAVKSIATGLYLHTPKLRQWDNSIEAALRIAYTKGREYEKAKLAEPATPQEPCEQNNWLAYSG